MLADLQCLACHSLDKESWIVLKDLFVRKWREEKKFPNPEVADAAAAASAVSYLENNWFAEDQPCMWFQGTVPLSPVTNNSLERQNGILKSAGYSGRQKLGLEELFNMVRFRRYYLTFSPLIFFIPQLSDYLIESSSKNKYNLPRQKVTREQILEAQEFQKT